MRRHSALLMAHGGLTLTPSFAAGIAAFGVAAEVNAGGCCRFVNGDISFPPEKALSQTGYCGSFVADGTGSCSFSG